MKIKKILRFTVDLFKILYFDNYFLQCFIIVSIIYLLQADEYKSSSV